MASTPKTVAASLRDRSCIWHSDYLQLIWEEIQWFDEDGAGGWFIVHRPSFYNISNKYLY